MHDSWHHHMGQLLFVNFFKLPKEIRVQDAGGAHAWCPTSDDINPIDYSISIEMVYR